MSIAIGQLAQARTAFGRAFAIPERFVQADASNAGWQRDLSVSYNRIGDVLVAQGNLPVSSSQQQLMPNPQG